MTSKSKPRDYDAYTRAIEIAIRLAAIFFIVAWCLKIVTPFLNLIAWGAIIAVALQGFFLFLVERKEIQGKYAATIICVVGIAVIVVPALYLSASLVESVNTVSTQVQSGAFKVPGPPDNLHSWPLVGEKLYSLWNEASVNLLAFIQSHPEQVSSLGAKLLGLAASVGGGIFQFVIAIIIAGVFLSNTNIIKSALHRFADRLGGENGGQLLNLSVTTIHSVVVGVLGIAAIESILAGIGMLVVDVPGAGLLAFIVLVLAIAQLPPLLVLVPVIMYVFSTSSISVAVIFMIWCVLVNMSDMVLKPILLGRGVDAPMLVILMGAIGGLIAWGFMGLFIGAVILTLGYKLFQAWLHDESSATQ